MSVIILWKQSWYKPADPKSQDDFVCHDNYAIYSVSVFQYITLAVVFSKGAPYRKAIYTNCEFSILITSLSLSNLLLTTDSLLASLLIMTVFTVYSVLYPHKVIEDLLEFKLTEVSMRFRVMMLCLAVINFVLAFLLEVREREREREHNPLVKIANSSIFAGFPG